MPMQQNLSFLFLFILHVSTRTVLIHCEYETSVDLMMVVLFFKLVEAMQIVVVRQALFGVWRLLWVRGLI